MIYLVKAFLGLASHCVKYSRIRVYSDPVFFFFFYTTDLHKHNTKTKSLLNKRATEPYLIYGDQIGETKKVKKKSICIHE